MADQAARIAIIGMAGRFPGARDIEEFWANLLAGVESIHQLTPEQMRPHEPDLDALLKKSNFVAARGLLDDVDQFDATFFGFSPREAATLDPQQRLWLETVWTALEQAGVDPARINGPAGVFAGSGYAHYLLYNLAHDRAYIENLTKMRASDAFATVFANERDYLPTRTAYTFNLRGPAVNLQTACSTALVAVHAACQSLLSFESDLAIAGGVSIAQPQERGYLAQAGGMVSQDGHCRPFDENACGTVFSSGLAAFVLKRYDEAVEEGDNILAVIRGSALNNDGASKVSFGAPSSSGQADVIAMAQTLADVQPSEVGYVETHGTGTPLGDPIEIDGLTRAWQREARADTAEKVMLGSVKSNIGHLDAAAGAAGLVKVVCALRHGQIPATLHFEKPNPRIDFAATPFQVVNKLTEWQPEQGLRIAGVSSFGVGGTNAHLVVEQAPDQVPPAAAPRPRHLLVLSAKTPTALARRCSDLADYLQAHPDIDMTDVAWTLTTGRAPMAYRSFVVADSAVEAIAQLGVAEEQAHKRCATEAEQPPVAFLFPGQGAQHPNMGRGLYESEDVFRDTIDRLADILTPLLELDIRDLLYPPDNPGTNNEAANAKLRDTSIAQPALFVVQLALAHLWRSWGILPAAMLGHSVGEYVAACLAGVFNERDVCTVLTHRAGSMSALPGGSMLALRRGEDDVVPLLSDDIALAAINGPKLCIVSGPDEAIDALVARLSAEGEENIRLHTSHAFHSPMMDDALVPFENVLKSKTLNTPEMPFVSCVTGDWITDSEARDPSYWTRQLRQTVRFSPALEKLLQEPAHIYLECGPSQNLTAAARQHKSEGKIATCVPSQAHASAEEPADSAMLNALGRLWQEGVSPDWAAVFKHQQAPRRRVHLPTYPFERQRYWIDPPVASSALIQSNTPSELTMPAAPDPVGAVAAQDTPMPSISRREHLADTLRSIILDLSGTHISPEEGEKTFPEMGMDSLFLTQVAAEISGKFDIELRFRQLLEDISSLDKLAAYLDAELDSAQFQPAVPAPATAASADNSVHAQLSMMSPVDGTVQSLIQQQLDIMRQQLSVLGGGPQTPPTKSEPGTNDAVPGSSPLVQIKLEPGSQGKNLAAVAPGRFGPYKTISREIDGELTPPQQQFLDDLIAKLTAKTPTSKTIAASARQYLADPRGVANFRLVWKEMVYQIVAERSEGAYITDVDGNDYIDITMGFGVAFMGHRHPVVVKAVEEQLHKGFEVGPQTPLAPVAAEKFCKIVGHERVTFCNTGSEAVMAALRCARTITNRKKVVYFTGDYHGTFDEVLGRANIVQDQLTSRPAAPGIAQGAVDNVLILDYGTQESLDIIKQNGDQIAAVLIETVQSRYPDLQPTDFVRELRRITQESGTALIMDEVITGFRAALGGLKALWNIDADMCTYGKILGGALPIGALGGKAKWLDAIDGGPWQFGDDSLPEAPVTFFAGTFVRHPLAMAAANAVLDFLGADGGKLQEDLNSRTQTFAREMNAFFEQAGAPMRIRECSSWFRFDIPQDQPFVNLLFYWMVANGIYIREAAQNYFFSIAHSDDDIDRVKQVIREGIEALQTAGFITRDAKAPTATVKTAIVANDKPASNDKYKALAVGESVELTEAQREVWLAMTVSPEAAPAYNEILYLDLEGDLDLTLIEQAVQVVSARHEALNLRMVADGESQVRVEFQGVDVPLIDLSEGVEPKHAAINKIKEMGRTLFDLRGTAPLLKFAVLRLAPRHHFFAMVVQHLVCDGWSMVVFLEEVGKVYSALANKREPDLPATIAFSSYARKQVPRARDAQAERAYWAQVFAIPPEPINLPTLGERPTEKTFVGATLHHQFDGHTLRAARRVAADLKVTPYAFFLAAYATLLTRLAGQEEVVVAIPVAGQALEGQNTLFGHCVQTLPIRISCKPGERFSVVLKRVRESVKEAYANADCTYGSILRELHLPRDPERLPLAEVLFNIDPAGEEVEFHGLGMSLHEGPKSAVNFDLFFNLIQGSDSLVIDCDYNTDLFSEKMIRSWIGNYEVLLRELADNPERSISSVSLVNEAERHKLIDDFNPAAKNFDDQTDLPTLMQIQANKTPQVRAIAHAEGDWSYAQLNLASDNIAGALAERGVAVGDIIGVCLPRDGRMIAALIGVLKCGAVYLPMDPAYPQERLAYMAKDSGAKCVLTSQAGLEFGATTLDIEQVLESGIKPPSVAVDATRPAYVIYTSGSTGEPKGVLVTHRNVLALVAWAQDEFSAEEFSGMLASTSICFDLSVFEIFTTLTSGGCLVLVDDLMDLAKPLSAPVTLINTVPSAMNELLRHIELPDSVLTVCMAGEPLSPELVAATYKRSHARRVLDLYGPSEATVYSTMASRSAEGPATIGRPLSNWRVYVLDDQSQPVPVGARGELVIGGDGVSLGYMNREELTTKHFVPDPFLGGSARMYKTGDLAAWREDGQIEFIGRADKQIKLRGFRIELGEIESKLGTHPDIEQAVVQVCEASPGDRQLVAYWRSAIHASETPTPALLRRYLREILPLHMVPQQIVRIDQWPTTPNGKLDRKSLPNPFAKARATAEIAVPSDDQMQPIAELWKASLGDISPRPQDTFLDLGGHSLLAVRATLALKQEHGIDIPVRAMMLDSLTQLAAKLQAHKNSLNQADEPSHAQKPERGGLVSRLGLGRKNKR